MIGMTRRLRAFAVPVALIALATSAAWAQTRPSEDEMFGGASPAPSASAPAPSPRGAASAAPVAPAPPPSAPNAANPAAAQSRDEAILGGTGSSAPMFTEPAAPDDPLKIGETDLPSRAKHGPPRAKTRRLFLQYPVPGRCLLRRAPERSRARFRARPHDVRSDASAKHVTGRERCRRHERIRFGKPVAVVTLHPAEPRPQRCPRSNVAAIRRRAHRVRDRGDAACALGHGAFLDPHGLFAPAPS